MPWIKIFISHSTKTEEARAFLDAVKNVLDPDFDLRLDQKSLEGGDIWWAQICQWIFEVHGAVLLLTKDALQSEFVHMEAVLLTSRSLLHPKFVLVPVLVGDVSVADTQTGMFGPMALDRFQFVTLKDPAAAQDIADCLKKLRKPDPLCTPRESLEESIETLLKDGRIREATLRSVGVACFDWTGNEFTSDTDFFKKFAADILNKDTSVACAAIKMLLVKNMGGVTAQDLLDAVFPFWVAEEAANPVIRAVLAETSKRGLSLNTKYTDTVHSYIGRSSCRSLRHGFRYYELQPPQLHNSFQDFRDQILQAVKADTGLDDDEMAKEDIRQQDDDRLPEPVFILFPPNMIPDVTLLDELREEFETVTFFVLADDEPKGKLEPLGDKIHVLEPLDKQKEKRSLFEYFRLKGIINNKGRSRGQKL